MGGVVGGLFGSSKSSGSNKSGYSALPSNLRKAFDPLGVGVGKYTNPENAGVKEMFTPMAQTADETAAFDAMRRGFTPTTQSLQSDMSMLNNPWNDYVLDPVNRAAGSDYSILKQDLNAAGQLGSNRQMLGANDIEQTRLSTIGNLKQQQYDTAMNQILNNLMPQRQQDAALKLGIGDFQRNLDMQTRQAPISALQTGTSMIAPFTAGGSGSESSRGPGLLYSMLSNAAGNL